MLYPFPGTTIFRQLWCRRSRAAQRSSAYAQRRTTTTGELDQQISEFGINKSMKVAAMLMFINDVTALGLDTAAGLNPDRVSIGT